MIPVDMASQSGNRLGAVMIAAPTGRTKSKKEAERKCLSFSAQNICIADVPAIAEKKVRIATLIDARLLPWLGVNEVPGSGKISAYTSIHTPSAPNPRTAIMKNEIKLG